MESTDVSVTAPIVSTQGKVINPASLGNLKSWKPGESGNLAGRPPNAPVVTPVIREYVQRQLSEIQELYERRETLRVVDAIAVSIIHDAVETGIMALKAREMIVTRLDGEPDKGGPPIAIQVNLSFADGTEA